MTAPTEPLAIGRLTTVFGIKGWLKVMSHTRPKENIFAYADWWLKTPQGWQKLKIDQQQARGKDLLIHIEGVDDRDQARQFCRQDIYIEKAALPELPTDEYYWHQLQGLEVTNRQGQRLGRVSHLLETGANDVLVVKGGDGSMDRRERLIPYIDQVVLAIDPVAGEIRVDWDSSF